jgi:hypothetical protein
MAWDIPSGFTPPSTYVRGSGGNLNLGQFVVQINAFNDKALKNVDKVVRKIVFEIFSRIVKRTPVDTGRARAGWMASSAWSGAGGVGGLGLKSMVSKSKLGPYFKTNEQGENVVVKNRKTTSVSERGVGAYIGAKVAAGAGTFDKSGGTTINAGKSFIMGEMRTRNGVIAYIYNNVRYVIYLEGGRVYPSPPYGSPQAPHGMVRITLAEYQGIAQAAITQAAGGG